jgi:hypothetical protein
MPATLNYWYNSSISKIIRCGIFLCIFLLPFSRNFGQSFHYFHYQISPSPAQTDNYNMLLTVYPNGTAEARIKHQREEQADIHLAAILMTDSVTGISSSDEIPDKSLIAYEITHMLEKDTSFLSPMIGFRKAGGENEIFYEPSSIFVFKNDSPIKAIIVEQITFSLENLSREIVESFYNPEEPFVGNLFAPRTRSLTAIEKKTKMHLLIVANTDDPAIGKSSRQDMFNISGYFTNLAEALGIPIERKTIWGRSFSKKAVEDLIKNLKPGPDDIVIFYYTGHGFRRPEDTGNFPHMVLSNNYTMQTLLKQSLAVEDIYRQIVSKGAKLNLVITDCCNEKIETPPPTGNEILTTKSIGLPVNIDNCRALFFPSRKTSILVTSADIDQLASGNPNIGGFFSWHFRASLENHLSPLKQNITWVQVLNEARINTARQALTARCFETRVMCQQYPWFRFQ